MRSALLASALAVALMPSLVRGGCEQREIEPGTPIAAIYKGRLAGVSGKHRCIRAQIKLGPAWPWPTVFQADCQPRTTNDVWVRVGHDGQRYSGVLLFNRDCSVSPEGQARYWYVEGTENRLKGGFYNRKKGRLRVDLKDGAVVRIKIKRRKEK